MVFDFNCERTPKYVLDTRSCGIGLELIELCCGLLAKRGVVHSHRQFDFCFHFIGCDSVVHAHCQFDSSLLLKINTIGSIVCGSYFSTKVSVRTPHGGFNVEKHFCHGIHFN